MEIVQKLFQKYRGKIPSDTLPIRTIRTISPEPTGRFSKQAQRTMPVNNVWFVLKRKKGMIQYIDAVTVTFSCVWCLCCRLYHSLQVQQAKEYKCN
jgi:hypothetical protein